MSVACTFLSCKEQYSILCLWQPQKINFHIIMVCVHLLLKLACWITQVKAVCVYPSTADVKQNDTCAVVDVWQPSNQFNIFSQKYDQEHAFVSKSTRTQYPSCLPKHKWPDMFLFCIWPGHETSNDNGVRIVNSATSRNLTVKSTMFSHYNIHKYMPSTYGKVHNQIDLVLTDRRWHAIISHI
jgi:hypothetical protein